MAGIDSLAIVVVIVIIIISRKPSQHPQILLYSDL